MDAKPHFKVIAGRPVQVSGDRVETARQRFGQKFAHEPGSTWTPPKTPVLVDWLTKRKQVNG